MLRTTSSTYTPSGKVATATDPAGNVTRFAYDLLDRQTTVTDAMGRVAQLTYDALGRPWRTYNTAIQAGPLVQRTYTADGQLAALADANGNTTSFAYDGFDRLATTTYPLGSTETFTYDALDNVQSRKTRAGATIAFGYDTLNRLISKTPPSGPAVTYSYDLNSRPTGVADNSAAIVAAVPPGSSTVTYGMTYAYDALNRLTGTAWDPAPAATAPTAGPLVTFGHTYNKVNQRTGQTVDDNTWLSYPAASPATTAYTANSLNQYTAVGATTPTYDGNGNLISDGTYALGYDLENRLTSASGAGNTAAYAFDAQGRRKSRTVNGTTTISVTDADNREVLEYDGSSGAILRWYAYGLGPNAALNQINVAGRHTRHAVAGHAGLDHCVVQLELGRAHQVRLSALWHKRRRCHALRLHRPALRSGERPLLLSGTALFARSGVRFTQADPIGYTGGSGLYAYARQRPSQRKRSNRVGNRLLWWQYWRRLGRQLGLGRWIGFDFVSDVCALRRLQLHLRVQAPIIPVGSPGPVLLFLRRREQVVRITPVANS